MAEVIGVGIVGASAERGWAKAAHIPALRALPQYALKAVSTQRRESAAAAADAFGASHAYDNHLDLVTDPAVELVVIAVNVIHHRAPVLAALAAGKMVYCEWPLGRDLAEAEELAAHARATGTRTIIGLQGRFAPELGYLQALIADGYIGRVLASHIRGCGPDDLWRGIFDAPYEVQAEATSGGTLLTIPAGHALDMQAVVLGEFTAVASTQLAVRGEGLRLRDQKMIPMTAPDEVALSGRLENGALASLHYHGGSLRDGHFRWEINGTEGDLEITCVRGYANMGPLVLRGARGADPFQPLSVPAQYVTAPAGLTGPAANIAGLYGQLARDLATGTRLTPDFDWALRRHRSIARIEAADCAKA